MKKLRNRWGGGGVGCIKDYKLSNYVGCREDDEVEVYRRVHRKF